MICIIQDKFFRVIKLITAGLAGHVAHSEQTINAVEILVSKAKHKISVGRHRHRCDASSGVYLTETARENVQWIQLAQDMATEDM
jgi:hypothetical protein